MFCSFHTIIRIIFTIMLIVSNVCAGFCWKKSWNPRCSYMYSSLWVIPIWGIDGQALIMIAVRGPLSVLFWSYYSHYLNIMRINLAIMLIISKLRMAFRVIIHCGNPPPWFLEAAQKQQLIIHRPLPSSPVQWMGQLPPPPAGPHTCPWGI